MTRCGTVTEVSQAAHGDRCRYTVLLARPFPQLAAAVVKIPGVSHVAADSDRVVLEFGITRDEAASLLLGFAGVRAYSLREDASRGLLEHVLGAEQRAGARRMLLCNRTHTPEKEHATSYDSCRLHRPSQAARLSRLYVP